MLLALGFLALVNGNASYAVESATAQRMKADFERKRAEQKRKFEPQKREITQSHEQLRQQGPQDITSVRTRGQAKQPTPTFNAASSPSPNECLLAFVAAAHTASSMESLLRFLPDGEQRTLRESQAKYDPQQAASGRAWHKKQNSSISEETLTHLSNPPFTNSLKFHKSLAGHIQEVLSVKIEGARAKLVVATTNGATVDGGYFPYSKASVEMVGEGNYWRLWRYQPSNVYYRELPTKP